MWFSLFRQGSVSRRSVPNRAAGSDSPRTCSESERPVTAAAGAVVAAAAGAAAAEQERYAGRRREAGAHREGGGGGGDRPAPRVSSPSPRIKAAGFVLPGCIRSGNPRVSSKRASQRDATHTQNKKRDNSAVCRAPMSSAALARRLVRQAAAGVSRRARSSEAAGCPFHRALEQTAHRSVGADQWSGRAEPSPMVTEKTSSARKPFSSLPRPKGLPVLGTTLDVLRAGGAPKIHEYCDRRHRELGPIYRETLGSVDAVFVADSALIQKVYTNEGKFPMHMVPDAWLIYNEVKGIQRGLFFM
ncbi:hypothetical protein HPB51_017465 [Rhipicephalus microplus]|uniref:Uncharacterized protein n=1 Tax=Rhipicephalus microplus TaxID=6941 RepID=A0A9J6F594_RHIMP|nr:hypothetical protein HPB51_017465 [Rhipicephalus microplus]